MFKYCPRCGAEYQPIATECADCQVPLAFERPAAPQEPSREPDEPAAPSGPPRRAPIDGPLELVTVLTVKGLDEVAYAKSLLEDAGIPFMAKNDLLQDLFGFGRMVPVNPISGPVIFQVAAQNAAEAREILAIMLEDEAD